MHLAAIIIIYIYYIKTVIRLMLGENSFDGSLVV